jgi:hypothetical protein
VVKNCDPSPLWGGSAERWRCAVSSEAEAGVGVCTRDPFVITPTRLAFGIADAKHRRSSK